MSIKKVIAYVAALAIVQAGLTRYHAGESVEVERDLALRQFEDDDRVAREIRTAHLDRNYVDPIAVAGLGLLAIGMFQGDVRRLIAQS